jgi:hypothetical protein
MKSLLKTIWLVSAVLTAIIPLILKLYDIKEKIKQI